MAFILLTGLGLLCLFVFLLNFGVLQGFDLGPLNFHIPVLSDP